MHERLSFYLPRASLLHSANPLTKLTAVFGLILLSYANPHPLFLFALIAAVMVLAALGKLARQFATIALRMLLPAAGFLLVMQALFIPGGKTVLASWGFLTLYRETLFSAAANAERIFLLISSFLLFILTTHPSQLMSDLVRRGLPGQLAYVVVSTLQILPQMQAKAAAIIAAQRSRGLNTQGSLANRVRSLAPLVGPLVFGSLVEVEERAIAIEARAFMSTLPKTALHQVPDTHADKAVRMGLILLVIGAFLLWR